MDRTVFPEDIGGSKLLCGLVLSDGTVLDTVNSALRPEITTEALEWLILEAWQTLREKHGEVEPFACGMTIPGVADAARGILTYACFSGVSDYPIAARMLEKLGVPVYIGNDGNACAWAERAFGVCKDCDNCGLPCPMASAAVLCLTKSYTAGSVRVLGNSGI